MGIASPYLATANSIHASYPSAIVNGDALESFEHDSRLQTSSWPNQDFTSIVERQDGLLPGAVADAGIITNSENNIRPKNPTDLNVTPIVWICVIGVAIVLLITFTIWGHRRQNKRDEIEGMIRNDEEQRMPEMVMVR
jgi:hypothetical protein